jgi:hypothetical protein
VSLGVCGLGTTQCTGDPIRSSVILPIRRSCVLTCPSRDDDIISAPTAFGVVDPGREREVMELVASLMVCNGSLAAALFVSYNL